MGIFSKKARMALGLGLCTLFGCGCAAGYAASGPQGDEALLRALYAQSAAAARPAAQASRAETFAAQPEPCGELVICMEASEADGLPNGALLRAVREFERLHPGLEIRIETVVGGMTDPARRERELKALCAAVEAGGGPDLFLFEAWTGRSCSLWPDLYRAMRQGAFLNCAGPLAAYGVDVSGGEFWQPVMQAGRLGEEQLLVPLSFTVPVALAGQKTLEEGGFDPARAGQSAAAFLEECASACARRPGQTVEAGLYPLNFTAQQVLDYDTGEVRLNTPAVRQMLAAQRTLLTAPWRQPEQELRQAVQAGQGQAYNQQQAARLESGDCLLAVMEWDCAQEYAQLLAARQVPAALLAFPNENGGVTAQVCSAAAIRRDAANPNAAAALLAFLLEEPQQNAGAYPGTFWGLPVRTDSLGPALDAEYEHWHGIWYLDPSEEQICQWEEQIGETFAPMDQAERAAYFEQLGQPVPPQLRQQLAQICGRIDAASLPSGWPGGPRPEEVWSREEAFCRGELTADELIAALQPLLEGYLREG